MKCQKIKNPKTEKNLNHSIPNRTLLVQAKRVQSFQLVNPQLLCCSQTYRITKSKNKQSITPVESLLVFQTVIMDQVRTYYLFIIKHLVRFANMTSSRGFYLLAAKSSSDIAQAWSTHKFWCFIILCLFVFLSFHAANLK